MGKKHQNRYNKVWAISPPPPPPPPISPFSSSLVSIQASDTDVLLRVHRDVLSRLQGLEYEGYTDDCPLVFRDFASSVLELVMCYLYGIPFEAWKHNLFPTTVSDHIDPDCKNETPLQPACEMLCFTTRYGLPELRDNLLIHIETILQGNYRSAMAAAKYIYTHATHVEPRFRMCFLEETRKALRDPDVAKQTWFVELFEEGFNGLSKDVFECYRDVYCCLGGHADSPRSGASAEGDDEPLKGAHIEYCQNTISEGLQTTPSEDPTPIDQTLATSSSHPTGSFELEEALDLAGMQSPDAWSEVSVKAQSLPEATMLEPVEQELCVAEGFDPEPALQPHEPHDPFQKTLLRCLILTIVGVNTWSSIFAARYSKLT